MNTPEYNALANQYGQGLLTKTSTLDAQNRANMAAQQNMMLNSVILGGGGSINTSTVPSPVSTGLGFALREIGNGYILKVCGEEECFCKELSDVGSAIVTMWAKHMVLDKE